MVLINRSPITLNYKDMETMLFFHTQRKIITQPRGKMSRKVRNAFTRTDVIHLRTMLMLSAKHSLPATKNSGE